MLVNSNADEAEAVVAEIYNAGGNAISVGGDVAEEAAMMTGFDSAERELGGSRRAGTVKGPDRLAD